LNKKLLKQLWPCLLPCAYAKTNPSTFAHYFVTPSHRGSILTFNSLHFYRATYLSHKAKYFLDKYFK